MVRVDLKGIAKVKAKGHVYYYAWRGGPRLHGEPGSPEFIASYNEAIEQRRTPDKSRFRFVVADYKASGEYKKLAQSTRDQWGRWLDRIAGEMFCSRSCEERALREAAKEERAEAALLLRPNARLGAG